MSSIKWVMLAFIFLSTKAQSQKGWAIGDQISFGHSWITHKPEGSSTLFHPHFQIGRKAIYQFNTNAGLGFGTYFSSDGGTWKNKATNSKTTFRLNYIRVPIIADFYWGKSNSTIQPHLAIGPAISFLVGGKQLTEINHILVGAQSKKIVSTDVDAGILTTIGLKSRIVKGINFFNDIQYYHGLVDQKWNTNSSFKNRSMSVQLGFIITKDVLKKIHPKKAFDYKYKDIPYKRKNIKIKN